MTSDSVLEWLRSEMGCCYLSDLHCLTGEKRSRMLDLLSRIPKNTATVCNWDDMEGITSGMTASQFAPDNICTRAQIVTFIYRSMR